MGRILNRTAVLWLALSSPSVFGDGLIQSLPDDGAWVRFNVICARNRRGVEDKLIATLTLRSVGTTQHNGLLHRWIEFEWRAHNEAGGDERREITKWLIPETELGPTGSPRAHAARAWERDDEQEVRSRNLSETILDDLYLPSLLSDRSIQEVPKTVEYQRGRLDLERCVTGLSNRQSSNGTTVTRMTHRYWITDSVPFGVAAARQTLEMTADDNVIGKYEWQLEVNDFGMAAVSALPNHD